MPIRHAYGDHSRRLLLALRRRGLLDTEALATWIGEATGHPVARQLVSQWISGDAHLPADVLPLLADFVGDADLVFGPLRRACTIAEPDAPAPRSEPDAIHGLSHRMATLQLALVEARAPSSAGGSDLTDDERHALIEQAERLQEELAHTLASLRHVAERPSNLRRVR